MTSEALPEKQTQRRPSKALPKKKRQRKPGERKSGAEARQTQRKPGVRRRMSSTRKSTTSANSLQHFEHLMPAMIPLLLPKKKRVDAIAPARN
jgi:hypothetical protein